MAQSARRRAGSPRYCAQNASMNHSGICSNVQATQLERAAGYAKRVAADGTAFPRRRNDVHRVYARDENVRRSSSRSSDGLGAFLVLGDRGGNRRRIGKRGN